MNYPYDLTVAASYGVDPDRALRKAIVTCERLVRHASRHDLPAPDFDALALVRLWNASGWRCLYSWQPCNTSGGQFLMTVDHLLPVSSGGGHALGNLVPASLVYNNWKEDKPLVCFLDEICLQRSEFSQRWRFVWSRWHEMNVTVSRLYPDRVH